MQVSVTTSVSDPPARYSITTNSSSPIRKLKNTTTAGVYVKTNGEVSKWSAIKHSARSRLRFIVTCLKSWQYWGSSAPSSPKSHWWWAPFWVVSVDWSVWWPPVKMNNQSFNTKGNCTKNTNFISFNVKLMPAMETCKEYKQKTSNK